jgi:prophage DNA circulation protein
VIGGARDWRDTLAPASFNGVVFFVDTESVAKSGRDVAVHSFVNAETHATEDMGRVPRELRVDGYICGDLADSDARALIEQCSTAGAFPLLLPMFGPYQARCHNCHASAQDRGKQGWVKFELEFIEAGSATDSFPATALGDRLAASTMDDMPDAASDAIANYAPKTSSASASVTAQDHAYEAPGGSLGGEKGADDSPETPGPSGDVTPENSPDGLAGFNPGP